MNCSVAQLRFQKRASIFENYVSSLQCVGGSGSHNLNRSRLRFAIRSRKNSGGRTEHLSPRVNADYLGVVLRSIRFPPSRCRFPSDAVRAYPRAGPTQPNRKDYDEPYHLNFIKPESRLGYHRLSGGITWDNINYSNFWAFLYFEICLYLNICLIYSKYDCFSFVDFPPSLLFVSILVSFLSS